MKRPRFEQMSLQELSDWVVKNNDGFFDEGDFPSIEDLDDEEEVSVRDEYEWMADEIFYVKTTS